MNQPTDILMDEHRVIEQVLSVLEKIAAEARESGRLNREHAESAVQFFRNFADRCHHGKEEVHLFPLMEARGFPREAGPTGVMRYEHEQGRAHVRAMAELAAPAAAGDAEALGQFIQRAQSFILLLRDHITKEDHCLFAMANNAFSERDQRELMERFEKVEAEEMGEGTHEKFLGIANALADAYGVPRAQAAAEAGHGHGCCHHGHH